MWEVSLISLSVCLYVLWVFLFVRVFKKAGLGYWGLLSMIPILVLPLLMVLAFAEWPTSEKAKDPGRGTGPSWHSTL